MEQTIGCMARQIAHWCQTVGISLSAESCQRLIDMRILFRIAGLYELDEHDLTRLPRCGHARARMLLRQIAASKRVQLHTLLTALSINGVGETIAITLEDHYRTLQALQIALPANMADLRGIGLATAQSIHRALSLDNLDLVELLRHITVLGAPQSLRGETIAITGRLSRPRSEVIAMVTALGGRVADHVSSVTTIVVDGQAGEGEPSRKRTLAARQIVAGKPLRMIREHEFRMMVGY